MNNKTILLTGGLGYIGSHIAVELLNEYSNIIWDVIIIDNLLNSSINKLDKLKEIIGINYINNIHYHNIDLLNIVELNNLFKIYSIDIVIHLAGLKSVNESVLNPIYYYENNILSTLNLIKIMNQYNCKNLIFSSSATVYGNLKAPYIENMNVGNGISNPYGKTKYMQEEILKDLYTSDNGWNIILLRYFNPVSQKCNLLKEDPNGIPNNLFPYLVKVYNGELEQLSIYGNNYDTPDGTCVRDFIHVVDLAQGHISACNYLLNNKNIGLKIYNLGTGKGISVKNLIDKFEEVNNTKLNYKYVDRRPGDLSISYADSSLAKEELKWECKKNLEDIVKL
jgi:UDP-glucose 4-epimerase